MNQWWKAPVLQGEDNDYGQYDYLIEEIPQDYARWEFDRESKWSCHECKKLTHLLFRSEHFFRTLDGWDSIDHAECLGCRLKGKLRCIKWKAKKNIKQSVKTFKLAMELHQVGTKSFKDCYKLAKKIER